MSRQNCWPGVGKARRGPEITEAERTGAEGMTSPVTVGNIRLTNTSGKNLQIVLFCFLYKRQGVKTRLQNVLRFRNGGVCVWLLGVSH